MAAFMMERIVKERPVVYRRCRISTDSLQAVSAHLWADQQ
jgi:hypothetical protein